MNGVVAPDDELLAVASFRVQRVIDAISMIGVGELATALETLPEPLAVRDPFDMLEACVRVLIGEVRAAQAESERANGALEASRQQLVDKLAVIQRQTVALADLSTPIIEVWDRTLVLPIIGAIDHARAAAISEALLLEISRRRARDVLLDLTGVAVVDAATFEHLVGLGRAASLIGARCTLIGLRPSVAATVVEMGLDIGALRTLSTLKEGLFAVIAASQRRGR
jgi:rsbT co-antagonist protein RsbR